MWISQVGEMVDVRWFSVSQRQDQRCKHDPDDTLTLWSNRRVDTVTLVDDMNLPAEPEFGEALVVDQVRSMCFHSPVDPAILILSLRVTGQAKAILVVLKEHVVPITLIWCIGTMYMNGSDNIMTTLGQVVY